MQITAWHTLNCVAFLCQSITHLLQFPLDISQQHKEAHLGFTESNIALCSLDLFQAGTETTSTTMLWAMVFLIKHPDVQGRWHARPYTMLSVKQQTITTQLHQI